MEQMDIKQMLKRVACAALAVIMAAGAAVCGTSVDAEAAVGREEYKLLMKYPLNYPSYMEYDDNSYIEYKPGYYISEEDYKEYKDRTLLSVPKYADPNTETYDNKWFVRTGRSYKEAEKKLKNRIIPKDKSTTYEILKIEKATNPVLKKKCQWKRIENMVSEGWEEEHHKKLYAWTYPGQFIPNIPSRRWRNKKKPIYYYYQNKCTTKGFEKWLPAQKASTDKSDFDKTHAIKVNVLYPIPAEENFEDFKKYIKENEPSNDAIHINLKDEDAHDIAETLHKALYKKNFSNGHVEIYLDYKYDNPADVNNARTKIEKIEQYMLDDHGATPFIDLDGDMSLYDITTSNIAYIYSNDFVIDPTKSMAYYSLGTSDESRMTDKEIITTYRYCVDHPDFMQHEQDGFYYSDGSEE